MHDRYLTCFMSTYIIHSFSQIVISWFNDPEQYKRVYFLKGWMKITCVVNIPGNATIWFDSGKRIEQLEFHNEKIMLFSKNVFTVTNLTKRDRGQYICEVSNQKKKPAIKGKSYLLER